MAVSLTSKIAKLVPASLKWAPGYTNIRMYEKIAGVPDITLSNGMTMPQIGYGTWKTKPEQATASVKWAIDVGYRHIDCAYTYANEKEVGDGIRAKIEDGTIKREDLFITGKVWNTFHRKDMVAEGLQLSLDDLGLEYLDLYLMHWPMAFKQGRERRPKDENRKLIYDTTIPYTETWQAMEELMDTGKVKALGVCNFKQQQLQDILDIAKVKPLVLQIECNPHMRQERLTQMCKENDMRLIAHSPLGSYDYPWRQPEDPYLLNDPKVLALAKKLGKKPAQVVLRWNIQRGVMVIPKSVTPSRIRANFEVFSFSLSDEDMAEMNSFEDNYFRTCSQRWLDDHPYYPFNDPN